MYVLELFCNCKLIIISNCIHLIIYIVNYVAVSKVIETQTNDFQYPYSLRTCTFYTKFEIKD